MSKDDPVRIGILASKAAPLLNSQRRSNTPRGNRERLVGFVIDQDDIGLGLSEPLFALDALVELARTAIARAEGIAQKGSA